MSQEIIAELQDIAARVRRLFPDGHCYLNLTEDYISVDIHQIKTYAEATEVFRKCGVQKRNKRMWTDPQPRTVLTGSIAEKILLTVYVDDLSPTCHVEKYVEKIPIEQTVTTDEYVEVERLRIVCGEKEEA